MKTSFRHACFGIFALSYSLFGHPIPSNSCGRTRAADLAPNFCAHFLIMIFRARRLPGCRYGVLHSPSHDASAEWHDAAMLPVRGWRYTDFGRVIRTRSSATLGACRIRFTFRKPQSRVSCVCRFLDKVPACLSHNKGPSFLLLQFQQGVEGSLLA
ncbi:hypothetical protein C8R45DRAFT_611485 [Mycena sanguinolenta]|nr:hypothetical protein C8R45DRAFT_611485 [Mycena sanguinolenta]